MIETPRLLLRPWEDRDRAPFHALCRDPQVMATLGPLMLRSDSDALIDRLIGFDQAHGHTFWAIERKRDAAFLGFCGIKPGAVGTPIEGQLEIGWRLVSAEWGKGLAREAAAASLAWTWANLPTDTVWAITARTNDRSWGLMERLGMTRIPDADFDHPLVIEGSDLRPHIVYRIERPA